MKLLVYGGREYANKQLLFSKLDTALEEYGEDLIIIQGGCRTGADKLADDWALSREVDCLRVAAKWTKYSGSGGPIRNRRMRDKYRPDLAIKFPGGKGTKGMTELLDERHIPIMHVDS